jgi:tRNA/rRNA methyltransferase
VALLFGPEDRGLANEELVCCNQIITIPTMDFSSLNLGQAVAILCHELHGVVQEAVAAPTLSSAPRQADKGEMEAMFAHVEEALAAIGFLQGEKNGHWLKSIRRFLGRLGLRSREVKIIRGICRQLLWLAEQGGGKEARQKGP